MAVLVSSQSAADLKNQSANPRTHLMVKANKEVNNLLYFFALGGVQLKKQKITGYCWHKTNKMWLQQDFRFPDVLYIKCKIEKRYTQTFTELCNIVTRNSGELITHHRFDKWRLYQIMSKDPVMKSYLPVTRTVKQRDDIEKMLKRYKVVYLKSHIGRKGENVVRVELLPDGGYRYSYYRYGLLTARSVFGYSSLLNTVNRFFQGEPFIVQQGIELLKFKNQLIDMRAELQRNRNGDLDIVGISVRYGRPGSPITTHGEAFTFDEFFVKNMGYSKRQLETFRSVVQKFLFSVYEYIDNNYGRYAEMGIDFAIDANKNIWFIEANSQSTKVSLHKAYGKEALYRYDKNILEYARYLSNRPKGGISR
jgi:hypothetical protein